MPNYRRSDTRGATYFFTVITHKRRKILTKPESVQVLREVVIGIKAQSPFAIDGWVLLPDHIHAIWTLPAGDSDFSKRWGKIKAEFTKRTKYFFHKEDARNESRVSRRESTIWQRRFWEHQIRDECDFERHMDYLHYNPVKHGLVTKVKDWPYSTFHPYVKQGAYGEDWGGGITTDEIDFGE